MNLVQGLLHLGLIDGLGPVVLLADVLKNTG